MRPRIAILAAFLPIFSVALRQAQTHGAQSSFSTIASGSSIGSSRASPLSLPQPNVLAASAVRSKACKPKRPRRDSSDRAVNQPVWRLSKRTLRIPADYQGNFGEFVLVESDSSFRLLYDSDNESQSVGKFFKLGNQRLDATVSGLYGCTAVIVVSGAGMWLAHFWEVPSFRDDEADDGGWDEVLDRPEPRSEADRARFMKEVLLPMQQGGPRIPGLRQYINPGSPFHRSQRVEYAIITPRLPGSEAGRYEYEPEVREISAVMDHLFPDAHSVVIDYERKPDAFSQDLTAAGKLLFQYDPWEAGPCNIGQEALYRVWFEDGHIPILNNQWPALPQQIIERPEDYHPRHRRANVNACGSSKPPAPPSPQKTVPETVVIRRNGG